MASGKLNPGNYLGGLALQVKTDTALEIDEARIISPSGGHAIFIVSVGPWNYNQMYAVFPQNGGTPVVKLLAAVQATPTTLVTFAADSTWGLKITNTSGSKIPLNVIAIHKIL